MKGGALLCLLLVSLFAFAGVASAATIYVPDDYATIQEAVGNAAPGDTVVVRDGVYTENVEVDKPLTLTSENGSENCVVRAADRYDDVFYVAADRVNISGFTIKGGLYGIHLEHAENCYITNNNVSENCYGGIYLNYSSNNAVCGNAVSENYYGIYLNYSSNNTRARLTTGAMFFGIYLNYSSNNAVCGNNVSENWCGICLWESSGNVISGNNVSGNGECGICLGGSNNNTVCGNTVSGNGDYGICLDDSSGNLIYLNNFIDNADNVYSYDSTNVWNTTAPVTYTYGGRIYTNYLGNYWSDYAGSDADGDGIGDTPYGMDGDEDCYPLVEPFENYVLPPTPSVSVSTDKYEYAAGDTMLINITLRNPAGEWRHVRFLWRFDVPDYGIRIPIINARLWLPPGYERTLTLRWRLPAWRLPFKASWYVALFDAESSELISDDRADWRYVARKGMGMVPTPAEEVMKEVKRVYPPF